MTTIHQSYSICSIANHSEYLIPSPRYQSVMTVCIASFPGRPHHQLLDVHFHIAASPQSSGRSPVLQVRTAMDGSLVHLWQKWHISHPTFLPWNSCLDSKIGMSKTCHNRQRMVSKMCQFWYKSKTSIVQTCKSYLNVPQDLLAFPQPLH